MDLDTTTMDPIDRILAKVDPTPNADSPIPLKIRQAAEAAAKTAYFTARAKSTPREEATKAAQAAYDKAIDEATKTTITIALPPEAAAKLTEKFASGELTSVAGVKLLDVRPSDEIKPGQHDEVGAARSQAGREALRAAGFAPADPIYRQGTRADAEERGTKLRREFDAKPLVTDYCASFEARIAAERRRIVLTPAAAIGMDLEGRITAPELGALAISPNAFAGLTSRLGYGGAQYLTKCATGLRAQNVNAWRERIAAEERAATAAVLAKAAVEGGKAEDQAKTLALRVREGKDAGEHIFAAVSDTYTPFDADKIAKALAKASPADARGTVTYDGTKARFEVLFHSNVAPRHYVAGEFFQAGVIIRTDDTGSGAVRVSAAAWQNLCLNLIIIDRCAQELASIRHVGSILELTKRFENAFRKALDSVAHFIRAWGFACEESVMERSRVLAADMPSSPRDALPGIFNGILNAKLIPLKTREKRSTVIDKLVECWERDESGAKLEHGGFTRAAIVNAFTRFAHEELVTEDPWAEDEIQRSAGALLWGPKDRQPAPLPYLSLDDVLEETAATNADGSADFAN